jgi:hypothetical protein
MNYCKDLDLLYEKALSEHDYALALRIKQTQLKYCMHEQELDDEMIKRLIERLEG